MSGNHIWAILCFVVGASFLIFAFVFALLKEKGAILLSGFNWMEKEKRKNYNQGKMSKDARNSFLIWTAILFVGGAASYFVSYWFAVIAFAAWLILFFREVKLDPDKAFEKYKK